MNRIRIEEPEHRKDSDDGFKLHYVKQAALAPGISMKAWIEFKLPPDHEGLEEMQDRLVVTGGPPRGKPAKVEVWSPALLACPPGSPGPGLRFPVIASCTSHSSFRGTHVR